MAVGENAKIYSDSPGFSVKLTLISASAVPPPWRMELGGGGGEAGVTEWRVRKGQGGKLGCPELRQ